MCSIIVTLQLFFGIILIVLFQGGVVMSTCNDGFGGASFCDNDGEEFKQKFLDAVCRLAKLRREFFGNYYDCKDYRARYEEEIGDFFTKLRLPKLCISGDADLALVSIGVNDPDHWGSGAYIFLVDSKYADGFKEVGETALEEYFREICFYRLVTDIVDCADFVRMKIIRYALERNVAVYREFCPAFFDRSQRRLHVYEEKTT